MNFVPEAATEILDSMTEMVRDAVETGTNPHAGVNVGLSRLEEASNLPSHVFNTAWDLSCEEGGDLLVSLICLKKYLKMACTGYHSER